MWRCLVERNVRMGQVSNVGCKNGQRPMVVNNRHKLEKKYQHNYKEHKRHGEEIVDVA